VDEASLAARAAEPGVVATVTGTCLPAESPGRAVTITLVAASPYPVALLQEPVLLTLQGSPAQIETFTQAAVLYALGQYQEARTILDPVATELSDSTGASVSLSWLWGNILLRVDEWEGAIVAYSRALGLTADAAVETNLYANRALAAFFTSEGNSPTPSCRSTGRADAATSVDLAPERADLHTLLGLIALLCPDNSRDVEEYAGQQATAALLVDDEFAPALALMAEFHQVNFQHLEHGNPLMAQSQACAAMARQPWLPLPYRTMGKVYARHGLSDEAREMFAAYGRAAVLEWQRKQAALLMHEGVEEPYPIPVPPGERPVVASVCL
jgi:tetratricopeptide (TPR) repeat protein